MSNPCLHENDIISSLFVNDPEMMEFPFSSSNYSIDELDTLEHMARKMNLEVFRKEEVGSRNPFVNISNILFNISFINFLFVGIHGT